jgi:hypothetical protein
MRAILEPAKDGIVAPTRVLLPPAAYSAPEDFLREGFAKAVSARALGCRALWLGGISLGGFVAIAYAERYGHDDRFAASHRLMAAALAPASVDVVPGGHDWPAWRRLWENFLDTRFPSDRAPTP